MKSVSVSLGQRSYSIEIGCGLISRLGVQCAQLGFSGKCAIISDTNVAPLYGSAAEKSLREAGFEPVTVIVKAGETAKSLSNLGHCYDALAAHRMERKSFVMALGGGVVGDLAGFAAASYMRGVPFVQVPTTLLSQVDSSVGGKVGINLKAGKNLAGAFHQPRHVFCDIDTLQTLPERELLAGISEVIKYGIIADAAFFKKLEETMLSLKNKNPDLFTEVIARCCELKAWVVGQDETESGLRAILNFGHTIGHAIEAISGYGKYLHGEAIAIGQAAAAHISAKKTGLSMESVGRIVHLLELTGLPVRVHLTQKQRQKLLSAMTLDKKVSEGVVKFVLIPKLGEAVYGQSVDSDLIQESLDFVDARHGKTS